MKIDKTAVGIRIHELRTEKNMSMDKLATSVALSGKSTVNEWEKGRSLPSPETLKKIALLFSVTQDFLLYGSLSNYVSSVLKKDGINDSEFNNLLWEYINLTSNTNDMLSGISFNPKTFDPIPDEEQYQIYDSITNNAISDAIKENLTDFTAPFNKRKEYPSQPEIIQSSIKVLQRNVNLIKRTFTGKIHKITQELEQIDSFEYLNPNVTLEDYLNSDYMYTEKSKSKKISNKLIIDKFYQSKLNAMTLDFQEKLSELEFEFHESLNKYPDNKKD